MAITISTGHTFAGGELVTPTKLNDATTITIAAAADTLLGATATGTITEITCTAAGRALLDDAAASNQRTTLGLGTVATQNASAIALTGGNTKLDYYAATPSTLGYSATVDLDFSTAAATLQTLTLTGNVTFTTSNLAAGTAKALRIVGDSSQRTLSFPAWKFIGASTPSAIAANKTARINIESWGTADASVVAFYSVEP